MSSHLKFKVLESRGHFPRENWIANASRLRRWGLSFSTEVDRELFWGVDVCCHGVRQRPVKFVAELDEEISHKLDASGCLQSARACLHGVGKLEELGEEVVD